MLSWDRMMDRSSGGTTDRSSAACVEDPDTTEEAAAGWKRVRSSSVTVKPSAVC